jgi:hypothetical protein
MIRGDEIILHIYDTTELKWYPIGCLTSNSFTEDVEAVRKIGGREADLTAGWTNMFPLSQSYEINFAGVLTLDDRGGTVINYEQVRALKRARTKIQWHLTGLDVGGRGYITSLGNQASVDEFVSFDGTITGVGAPVSGKVETPSYPDIEDPLPYYHAQKE